MLIQETKLLKQHIPVATISLRNIGWNSFFSPAVSTNKGAISAGAARLWRPHITATRTFPKIIGYSNGRTSAVEFRFPGIGLGTVISMYGHVNDQGITQTHIHNMLPTVGDHFLAMGDFIMPIAPTAACIVDYPN